MKPEQLIRDFGEKKARDILNDTPAQSYFTCFCEECGWGGSSQKLNVNGYDRDWIACPECYSEKIESEDAAINDLKRLVESLEIINNLGGVEKLTPAFITTDKHVGYTHVRMVGNGRLSFLDDFCDFIPDGSISIKRVMTAIRDHESIYGGGQ